MGVCHTFALSSSTRKDFPCLERLPMYGTTSFLYMGRIPHVWEDFASMGRLRTYGKTSHVWEDSPYMGRLPIHGKQTHSIGTQRFQRCPWTPWVHTHGLFGYPWTPRVPMESRGTYGIHGFPSRLPWDTHGFPWNLWVPMAYIQRYPWPVIKSMGTIPRVIIDPTSIHGMNINGIRGYQ